MEEFDMLVEHPCHTKAARARQRITTVQKARQDRRTFNLKLITQILGISAADNRSTSAYKAPVIVCLDTEGRVRELGLCIFDTRDLKTVNSDSDLSKILHSYNFIFCKRPKAEEERPFIFGTSQRLSQKWTSWLLGKVMRTGFPDPDRTESRNVILVGHSIMCDLEALTRSRRGKFDMTNFPDVPIVDTTNLAREIWWLTLTPSLLEVVGWLGIDTEHMIWHNAGNDANVTMKVLLRLALIKGREMPDVSEEQQERAKLIQKVINTSFPSHPSAIDRTEYDKIYDKKVQDRRDDWLDACEGGLDF